MDYFLVLFFLLINSCSSINTEKGKTAKFSDPYLVWIQEINNRIFELQDRNKENIYCYGISKENEIASFTKIMQESEVRLFINFTEKDTLSVISKFKAQLEMPSKLEIFSKNIHNYYTEYKKNNNVEYISSEFENLIIHKSPLKFTPDMLKVYSQEEKTINDTTYSVTISYLNKQEVVNLKLKSKFYSRAISDKETEFINNADYLYNKILNKKEN